MTTYVCRILETWSMSQTIHKFQTWPNLSPISDSVLKFVTKKLGLLRLQDKTFTIHVPIQRAMKSEIEFEKLNCKV
jgi:hypothetical protein